LALQVLGFFLLASTYSTSYLIKLKVPGATLIDML